MTPGGRRRRMTSAGMDQGKAWLGKARLGMARRGKAGAGPGFVSGPAAPAVAGMPQIPEIVIEGIDARPFPGNSLRARSPRMRSGGLTGWDPRRLPACFRNERRNETVHRHLMTATALVAASMLAAGGAVAADKKKNAKKPSISVNGYYDAIVGGVLDETHGDEWGGHVSNTDTTRGSTSSTDPEIHFNGRATLENGMKIHVRTWSLKARITTATTGPTLPTHPGAAIRSTSTSCRSPARSARSSWAAPAVRGGQDAHRHEQVRGRPASATRSAFDNPTTGSGAPLRQASTSDVLQHSRLDTGDGGQDRPTSRRSSAASQIGMRPMCSEAGDETNDDNGRQQHGRRCRP